jgi:probable rRNA maturation factor
MPDYAIEIQDEYGVPDFPSARVIKAISYILSEHNVAPGQALTVVVTSDDEVRKMNAQYRSVDAPTDILSFPADPLPPEITDEPPYLGDLIIAYPYTVHQAQETGYTVDDELVLLVIHGTLHLLGYDHGDTESQDKMWAEQAEALTAMGVSIDVPRFTFGDSLGT